MFSIIVPVFNVEKYLRQCLDSVIQQSFQNFEVICVNDGSTDRSLSILQEYLQKDTRIKLIDQANRGLSAARNAGIDAAKGEYVFFLDSDDWIEPDTLKILSEKQNGEDLVCFNGRRYFEDGRSEESDKGIEDSNLIGWDYYNKYASKTRKFDFVCSVLRIYKRSFLKEKNVRFAEKIYHEDNLFTPIVCFYARSVSIIPDSLYVYRIRSGSITQSVFSESSKIKRIYDIAEVNNRLMEFFILQSDINKKNIYQYVNTGFFHLINMINAWELNYLLDDIYNQINWVEFKRSINGIDSAILFFVLKKKWFRVFYKIYYFDFYICRKMFRKLTLYSCI